MTKKIKKFFENINKVSKNILIYGSLISYLLIILGICLLFLTTNRYYQFVAQELIKASFLVFAEIIIGGLFFDLLSHNDTNE